MDELTRAVEMTKAVVMGLDAALLEVTLIATPRDYESLAKRIREIVVDLREQGQAIRAVVAQDEPRRN